jgi:chromosome segregation ATPase
MSLVQKLKELETENAGLKESAATACKAFAEIEVKIDDMLAAHAKEVLEMNAKFTADSTALNSTIAELTAELSQSKTELEKVNASLKTAEEKLGNPAFVDAAAAGAKPVSDVNSVVECESEKEFCDAYNAEKDPVKRTEMYTAYMAKKGKVK